jgi:hypothetical protein
MWDDSTSVGTAASDGSVDLTKVTDETIWIMSRTVITRRNLK